MVLIVLIVLSVLSMLGVLSMLESYSSCMRANIVHDFVAHERRR